MKYILKLALVAVVPALLIGWIGECGGSIIIIRRGIARIIWIGASFAQRDAAQESELVEFKFGGSTGRSRHERFADKGRSDAAPLIVWDGMRRQVRYLVRPTSRSLLRSG